jgi:NTE family protein
MLAYNTPKIHARHGRCKAMSSLSNIPLFSGLSDDARAELEHHTTLHRYEAGTVVVRRGDVGRNLYVVASGRVRVLTEDTGKSASIFMGPGEAFGEMSLLGSSPTSASVVADTPTGIFRIRGDIFHKLFANEPSFRQRVAELLAQRLRIRTSHASYVPTCLLVGLSATFSPKLPEAIKSALDRYVPIFPASRMIGDQQEVDAIGTEIDLWRASNSHEVFLVFVPHGSLPRLQEYLREDDAVVIIESDQRTTELTGLLAARKIDVSIVRVGSAIDRLAQPDEMWSRVLSDLEIERAAIGPIVPRETPEIDALARWMTRRSIGVALGAGAARGLAHLGFLRVLEKAAVPIDFAAGSSIGGIVALLYAMHGSAERAYQMAKSTMGSNRLIRDVSWIPRTSLFRGRKVRRNAERITAGLLMRDLKIPALAVSADLVSGRQAVLDCGSVATAAVATAAIPGVFPIVSQGNTCLVDGGLVSLVPVASLKRHRCGLKIAVNVQPDFGIDENADRAVLYKSLAGVFSIGSVITRAWELLGAAHGVSECAAADIVIRPRVEGKSGNDFDSFEHFVGQGEIATTESIELITSEVSRVLRPRAHR